MNIFAITTEEEKEYLGDELEKVAKVEFLTSGDRDIRDYKQLFQDESEKILVLNPAIIEWKLPNEVLSRIKNLKGICTSSAWTRFIDLDYCKTHNVVVTHTNGANSQSVAEYAIWMMLSLTRQLPMQIKNNYRVDNQTPNQVELDGKTMGIIGLGNVGSRVAELGRGLGMKVIYWNRSTKQNTYKSVTLDELLAQSDVIINCVEICPDTMGLLNEQNLCFINPSAFFVCMFGGLGWGVEDDQYLLDMVVDRKLAGFAVENEHSGNWNSEYPGNVFIPSAYAHHTLESEKRVISQWIEGVKVVVNKEQSNYRVV